MLDLSFLLLFMVKSLRLSFISEASTNHNDSSGIYSGVVCLSINAIFSNSNFAGRRRIVYVSYGIVQWLLTTMFFFSTPLICQMTWIEKRNEYAGGPWMYFLTQYYTSSYVLLGDAAQNLAFLLSDALLVSSSDILVKFAILISYILV
jgi:hypothetical protein